MTVSVTIMFEDATRQIDADTGTDLHGGMVWALERADQLGMAPPSIGPRPVTVEVHQDGILVIAIQVIPGGLIPR